MIHLNFSHSSFYQDISNCLEIIYHSFSYYSSENAENIMPLYPRSEYSMWELINSLFAIVCPSATLSDLGMQSSEHPLQLAKYPVGGSVSTPTQSLEMACLLH